MQLLLLEPRNVVSKTDAIGVLFNGTTPQQGRRFLSKAVSQARQVVGSDIVATDRNDIFLSAAVQTDLSDLRRDLRAALTLSPGAGRVAALSTCLDRETRLLPGEPDDGWLEGLRRDLDNLARSGRLILASDIESDTGSLAGWESAFRCDPTDDEVATHLVRGFKVRGEQAMAVRVYRECRAAMARRLGGPPSAELEEAAAGLFGSGPSEGAPGSGLLGREQETARILRVVLDAENGAGQGVLLTGPAGIGKTALLAAVLSAVRRQEWRVVLMTGGAGDDLVPFAALRSALPDLLAGSSHEVTLPRSVKNVLEPGTGGDTTPLTLPVLAADLSRLLDRLCVSAPTLLVFDDVHLMDHATHAVLTRLLLPRPMRSWSILLAARSDDMLRPVPLFPLDVLTIPLGPLDRSAATLLVRRHLEPVGLSERRLEGVVEVVSGWARGNPLFSIELTRHVVAGGVISRAHVGSMPKRIVEVMEARLAACSPGARTVLPLMALAQPHADYPLMTELCLACGVSRSTVAEVIDELVSSSVVVADKQRLGLSHPLWREVSLSRLNPLRLAALHRQIADCMERIPGRELISAGHRLAAFRAAPLVEYAFAAAKSGLSAGRTARALLADQAALELFAGALAAFETVPGRAQQGLRKAAFEAWLDTGHIRTDRLDLGAATVAYERALALAETDDERAAAWSAMGGISYKRGDFTAAERAYVKGLTFLRSDSTWAHARLGADIAWARHRLGDVEHSLPALELAASQFTATEDLESAARCFDLLAVALRSADRMDDALEASDRALALSDLCGDIRLVAPLAIHRAGILLKSGDAAGAGREAARAVDAAQRVGDRYVESVAHWSSADAFDRLGDAQGALSALRLEEVLLREINNHINLARCLAHQANLLHRLGRRSDSRQRLAEARILAGTAPGPNLVGRVEAIASGSLRPPF